VDEARLALERLIPVSPEELFELWVDPAQLCQWWAPSGYECSVDALETRPGGRWRTSMSRSGSKAIAISGIYRVVERPRRLAFTWAWEQDDGSRGHETEVSVTFEPVTGGTRLVLVQQPFENQQARDRHTFGWSTSLDRLEQFHAGN
jgi:uncharacterized protein YndB with AHSA1/START domain